MTSVKFSKDGLRAHFEDTLSAIVAERTPGASHHGIAVAYSGGVDSAVLLSIVAEFCKKEQIPVFAFHIHHGLSPNADAWLTHCQSMCELLDVRFFSKQVQVDLDSSDGIECSARTARYRALGDFCSANQIPLLLTAHHQDDQAETLLLQLLRGSGVSGLSGMDLFNYAPGLLGSNEILLARPFLGCTKSTLLDFAQKHDIDYVEDESNTDCRYARNALRHQVMPVLSKISQAYTVRLARSAQHVQTAGRLLVELAKIDMSACAVDGALHIDKMRDLSTDRVDNLLRYWFSTLKVRMPSTARLSEMRHQLFDARHDAMVTILHDKLGIHRYKNKIYAAPALAPLAEDEIIAPKEFIWSGEESIYFSEFSGTLHFELSTYGVDSSWLSSQNLTLQLRMGGERLKLAENRPTRDIKSHFQTMKIPFWQRQRLPFLYVNGELLHASGVGTQSKFCERGTGNLINFKWIAD
jgi:tRNA(Ile)-lysidine synthase